MPRAVQLKMAHLKAVWEARMNVGIICHLCNFSKFSHRSSWSPGRGLIFLGWMKDKKRHLFGRRDWDIEPLLNDVKKPFLLLPSPLLLWC